MSISIVDINGPFTGHQSKEEEDRARQEILEFLRCGDQSSSTAFGRLRYPSVEKQDELVIQEILEQVFRENDSPAKIAYL